MAAAVLRGKAVLHGLCLRSDLLRAPHPHVLAAPESALCGWIGVILLSLPVTSATLLLGGWSPLLGVTCFSSYALSLHAWTPLQLHSDRLAELVKWRALSGCCLATSLVACPGLSIACEMIPGGGGGGGGGGDTAAVLLGLQPSHP